MSLQVNVEGDFRIDGAHWQPLEEALEQGAKRFTLLPSGEVVLHEHETRLLLGPVVGEVTESSAVIMIEADSDLDQDATLACHLYEDNGEAVEAVAIQEKDLVVRKPMTFLFEDLVPGTAYKAVFVGLLGGTSTTSRFKTKPEVIDSFKLLAFSCDRPSRLLLGQLNPWQSIAKTVKTGRVDSVLHIGDQIYPDNENIANAEKIFRDIYDQMSDDKQIDMTERAHELWRQKYRENFTRPFKRDVLASTSNLMIWSDNDVANDFTTLKDPVNAGDQQYHPMFLKCGMEAYRDYQRKLWDPESDCRLTEDYGEVAEWHSHCYGPVGIFFFDLRGNRITSDGVQQSDNNLLSEAQWEAFENFMSNPDMRAAILCSETPFIGEEPEVCKEKVEAGGMDFLKDHWYYNDQELLKLVEICFNWKAEADGAKDVILVAGDIHCGVTSCLTDEETGLQINHYTTSPVTNHVCKFFPSLSGSLSERFHFNHLPLGKNFRNYLDVDIRFDEDTTSIQAKLIPISTDIFKNTDWKKTDANH